MAKKSNTKRADGRIAVQVYLGRVDGKRKYKTVYGATQKEADRKADEMRAKMRKGIDITADNADFITWSERWLAGKKNEVSADQYTLLQSRARYLQGEIGAVKLVQIRPYELQQVVDELAAENPYTRKPSAKKTIRAYAQVLNAVFSYAVDNRVMDFNPAEKLKISQAAPQSQRHALSVEERQRVINFPHRAQPAAMLMMFSGLRRGEATALLWSDIDLQKKTITVDKSYNFKQKEIKTPKNGKPRTVHIPNILVEYLKTLPRTSIYVLTSQKGKMLSAEAWKRMFDSYMYCMNLEYGVFSKRYAKFAPERIPISIRTFTPHDLRHTFCTIMYESGIDILVAKEQMGHADVKTTLSIYTHLQSEHKARSIEQMNQYLSPLVSERSFG